MFEIVLLNEKEYEINSPKIIGGVHKTKAVRNINNNFSPLYLDIKEKAINVGI